MMCQSLPSHITSLIKSNGSVIVYKTMQSFRILALCEQFVKKVKYLERQPESEVNHFTKHIESVVIHFAQPHRKPLFSSYVSLR